MEVSSSLGINTGLTYLNQRKAFDQVEHEFLWKTMEWLGCKAGLIAKIWVLNSDIESVLKFNGSLCASFRVHTGIRQGMDNALFLDYPLYKIHTNIDGLILPGFSKNIALSAYADDLIFFSQWMFLLI